MSEPLMPDPRRDQRQEPTAEDLDVEVAVDEQGGEGAADPGADAPEQATSQDDPPFTTPRAGDSLSPEELRRES